MSHECWIVYFIRLSLWLLHILCCFWRCQWLGWQVPLMLWTVTHGSQSTTHKYTTNSNNNINNREKRREQTWITKIKYKKKMKKLQNKINDDMQNEMNPHFDERKQIYYKMLKKKRKYLYLCMNKTKKLKKKKLK